MSFESGMTHGRGLFGSETGITHECGLFGIWGRSEAARLVYYGLHSLQHRGQDAAGIVVKNGETLSRYKGAGLLTDVFSENVLSQMKGSAAIGHVLYSIGDPEYHNAIQPLLFHFEKSSLAVCQNGAYVNAKSLRKTLENYGSIFQTKCNSEILAHIIRRSRLVTFAESVKRSLSQVHGGFAILMMTQEGLFAARDSRGLRPLVLGKICDEKHGDSYVISSETCALDTVSAKYLRDIEPGEVVFINNDGISSEYFTSDRELRVCGMEYIYIARPDSNLQGVNVHTSRKNAGRIIAQESPTQADIVIASPDTGISAAIGYAEAMRIPYEIGVIKSRYIGRTFISPTQELREQGVKMKLSAVRSIIDGKSVILVDDSIVRGTTMKHMATLLREAGAREVHVKVASPLFRHQCFYGIGLPASHKLISHKKTEAQIAKSLGMDSISCISEKGLADAIGIPDSGKCRGLCLACLNGDYPTHLQDFAGDNVRE
ncbi:MAG: amidophosphoribosyltransferase [Defluviitaleaceae bacterium]|nr:amidophosphoribosyltransferase [Defluviitaleaceae bacterium]